jgi:5-formyltetrahydrofolate cyclo-ligase
MTKAELRVAMRAARRDMIEMFHCMHKMAWHGLGQRVPPLIPDGAMVGCYVPVGAEINPARAANPNDSRLIAEVGPNGELRVSVPPLRPVAYPWFADAAAPMRFRLGPSTAPGPFGIPQPKPDAPLVEPDVLIIPLLAATPRGLRLGQGGGHYDRYLAARRDAGTPPLAIGVGFDMQIVDDLPADPWDMRMDFVVTPTRIFDCRS